MLINMQTKFVYVMFYNSVLNSYVVYKVKERKNYCAFCHMFKWEYTLFWIWDVGFLDGWEVGFDAIGSYNL